MSSLFSVFTDHVYNIPDVYQDSFSRGLSSAPILACLVAFACHQLPGFEIHAPQPSPILANFYAPPHDNDDDSDSDHSDSDDGDDSDGDDSGDGDGDVDGDGGPDDSWDVDDDETPG